jgi:CysZ protein
LIGAGLARGMTDVGDGFRFLAAHRGLWKWVLAPAVVTLALLAGAIAGAVALAAPVLDRAGWGGWILRIVVIAALVVGAVVVFVAVVGVVAGPFNEILSEKVEEKLTGRPGAPFRAGAFARGLVVGLLQGIWRLVVAVAGSLVVFAIALVPVIGTIAATVLGGWLGARATAYDCYDAVLARRDLRSADKTAYLRRHRQRTFGLGLTVTGLLLVPGVNLVALGVGAIGATLAAHELDAQGPAIHSSSPTNASAGPSPQKRP